MSDVLTWTFVLQQQGQLQAMAHLLAPVFHWSSKTDDDAVALLSACEGDNMADLVSQTLRDVGRVCERKERNQKRKTRETT